MHTIEGGNYRVWVQNGRRRRHAKGRANFEKAELEKARFGPRVQSRITES